MHGEDYVCLGFLFGEKCRVAYISDISRFIASTEYGECIYTAGLTEFVKNGVTFYLMDMISIK